MNYNLVDDEPNAPFDTDEGVTIRGSGKNPEDTVINAYIGYPEINVIYENLSIDAINISGGKLYEVDGDKAVVFRNRILKSGPDLEGKVDSTGFKIHRTAMDVMSQAVTLINSEVINGNTKPPSTTFTVGIEFYGDFRMMNSEVTGFT